MGEFVRDVSALEWLVDETGCSIVSKEGVAIDLDADTVQTFSAPVSYTDGTAETDALAKNGYVTVDCSHLASTQSLFRYFMDGSRMAYKIAEIKHNGKIWPIVAGQIGVAYCSRENREMKSGYRIYRTILAVPQIICGFGANESANRQRLEDLKCEVNKRVGWGGKLKFDSVVTYTDDNDGDKTNLAVSRIQALMVDTEKQSIMQLAKNALLADDAYLIKDGSLEYVDDPLSSVRWSDIEGRFQYVVGISKTFNADLFQIKVQTERQSAAGFIAGLKTGQRTHAFYYSIRKKAEPCFAVWYLRIRNSRLTRGVFDGIVKVEMQLIGNEVKKGKLSTEINRISAEIIRERNPVCYGSDDRWANHLYPVYITEKYLKSGFTPGQILKKITIK